ncbi:MAG: ATP-binding protein [Gammaproteobacteria bacterium]|nr:ATP-binding protein [Gammaproteobacteria bacterium]MDH5651829.1 ATP-binding protein [Gammaproteobacteria bacterium]
MYSSADWLRNNPSVPFNCVIATEYKRFYVRDFFPASVADPNPFNQNSSIKFIYETDDPIAPQELTVKRANSEWSGYKRQPERKCFYVGFTIYIPKVERKDASIYRGNSMVLTNQRPIPDDIKVLVGRILGQQYDDLHFQGVQHGRKSGELGIAERFGHQYSENNMGFGEGRTLYLVDLLENSPEQSLFVIEEPETSLHEHAQHELAKYLLDVTFRRHHQIILSTHSDRILHALPSESRLLLHRDIHGVAVYKGLSSTRARALLSLGHQRDLVVFVEDDFAKLLITEMIRNIDNGLLRAINIEEVGDTKAVRNAVLLMTRIGKNSIAIRDADIGPDEANGIFSFPGTMPPEKEVYQYNAVKEYLNTEFNINIDNEIAQRSIQNHHKLTAELSEAANTLPDYFRTIAIKKYIEEIGIEQYQGLVQSIQQRA